MKLVLTVLSAALVIAAQQPWAIGASAFLTYLAGTLVGTAHVPQPGTKAMVARVRNTGGA